MPLPTSGAIDFSDINVELGVAANTQRSLGGATTRTLYNVPSGAIRLAADGYGKSSTTPTFPTWYGKYSSLGTYNPQMSFVDNSGNIYQYLTSASSGVFGYGFIKLSSIGNVSLQRTVSTNGSTRYFTPGIKTSAANNSAIWVVVNDEPTNGGVNYALNLIKYDLNGNLLWNRRINLNTVGNESQVRLAVDSSGNSWLCSGNGTTALHIFKHDTNGNFSLQTSFNNVFTCNAVTCDGAGNVYIAGNVSASNLFIIIKLNTSGALQFRRTYSAAGVTVPRINAIYVTSGGVIGLAGELTIAPNTFGLFMQLNSTGQTINYARYTTSVNSIQGVVCDSSNNFYFVGRTTTGTQSWLVKYNSGGTIQFQRQLGGTGTQVRDISINSTSAYIYVTMSPSASNVGLVSLPVDGTKTGTYSTLSYASSSFVIVDRAFTSANANSFTQSTPAFTSANNNPPPSTVTSTFVVTKTNIP